MGTGWDWLELVGAGCRTFEGQIGCFGNLFRFLAEILNLKALVLGKNNARDGFSALKRCGKGVDRPNAASVRCRLEVSWWSAVGGVNQPLPTVN